MPCAVLEKEIRVKGTVAPKGRRCQLDASVLLACGLACAAFLPSVAESGVVCGTKGGERPFSAEPGATADEATVKVANLSAWEVATLFFAADGR